MELQPEVRKVLEPILDRLRTSLGSNLHACALYGSAVRGNFVPGVSDINLLIVLGKSNPEAHVAISQAIRGKDRVEPFVLGQRGFLRSVRAFAPKFLSIRRNYRVLHGTDPLEEIRIDAALERFLCEQALRNLRLRLVHAFLVFGENRERYGRYLINVAPALLTSLSEVLRLEGREVPKGFPDRIPVLEATFDADGSGLRDLLRLREKPRRLSTAEVERLHRSLFSILDRAVTWLESRWSERPG